MLKLKVSEMTCGGCENKVRKALSQVEGIEKVDIDRGQKLVSVVGAVLDSAVVQAIEGIGFTAEPLAA